MSKRPPDWKRPPVIEVVLGVQFAPLAKLSNGHLGWFWGEMQGEFPTSDDVPPIEQEIGAFDSVPFGFPAIGLRPSRGDARLRMTSADGTRMIQVQNGWLIVNWMKKGDTAYPGYTGVRSLLDSTMERFGRFLERRELGVMRPNIWEVTYIDHIPAGTVWNTLADLPRVFPGLFGGGPCANGEIESINAAWSFRLSPRPGRLRLSVRSARTVAEPERDVLRVQSVARGPIEPDNAGSLDDGLNFGRSSVVDTFVGLASNEARQYWKQER